MPTTSPIPARELETLASEELIERYASGLELLDPRVFELSDDQLDLAFLPDAGVGRWPIRVLLGHLADAELVFVHRMRRAVAEERPVLAVWDENAFIDSGLYGGIPDASGLPAGGGQYPIGGFLATIHTLRRWHSEWLATLGESGIRREAMHPERGVQSVKLILAYDTWHLEHHARFFNAKIEKMLGPAPEGGCCGGSGGGCGCSH